MAIAYDATSGVATGWTTSDSFSHTCTGSDRLLLVWVFFDRGNGTYTVSSATYNGVSLSQVTTFGNGAQYVELWRLVAPATGANTLALSYNNAGPTAKVAVRAVSYTGVDGTTPLGSLSSATGTSKTPTVTLSSASGELVADFVSPYSAGIDLTVGSGQTSRAEVDNASSGFVCYGVSDEAGAASVTMSWSWTSANDSWFIGAIPIKPTGAAAGGIPKTTLQTLLGVG